MKIDELPDRDVSSVSTVPESDSLVLLRGNICLLVVCTIVKPLLFGEFTHTILVEIVRGPIDDGGGVLAHRMNISPLCKGRLFCTTAFHDRLFH